jgi:NADP-dependent 3-hydroxy acid dehydrogenase YdfG
LSTHPRYDSQEAFSGIGETTARAFAAGGARVALLARRRERVEALAAELGEAALPIQADVRDLNAASASRQGGSAPASGVSTAWSTTPA